MIPHRAKRDAVEPEIVEVLTALGYSVQPLSAPGAPDLLVGKGKRLELVECKSAGAAVTPAQAAWRRRWRGPAVITLTCAREARAVFGGEP